MRFKWVLTVLLVVIICSTAKGGLLDNDPFLTEKGIPVWAREREVLLYKVSFYGISAGYAELSSLGEKVIDGEKRYHIRARIWTTGLVKFFKKIEDVFDFFVDDKTYLPIKAIVKQRESNKKVDKITYYNQLEGKVTFYSLDGKILGERVIVPEVYEPITVAYFLRTLDLESKPSRVKVYGGKKLYDLDLEIKGKERVRTELGVFDTVKVNPIISREGKKKKGVEVTSWLINDGSNIPLLVHAKLKIGTLTGELIEIRRGLHNGQ